MQRRQTPPRTLLAKHREDRQRAWAPYLADGRWPARLGVHLDLKHPDAAFFQTSFFWVFNLLPPLSSSLHFLHVQPSQHLPHIFAFGGWGNIKTELRWRWPHQPWSCQTTPKETAGTSPSKSLSSPSSSIQHPSQISGESIHHHQNCQPHLLLNLDFLPSSITLTSAIFSANLRPPGTTDSQWTKCLNITPRLPSKYIFCQVQVFFWEEAQFFRSKSNDGSSSWSCFW